MDLKDNPKDDGRTARKFDKISKGIFNSWAVFEVNLPQDQPKTPRHQQRDTNVKLFDIVYRILDQGEEALELDDPHAVSLENQLSEKSHEDEKILVIPRDNSIFLKKIRDVLELYSAGSPAERERLAELQKEILLRNEPYRVFSVIEHEMGEIQQQNRELKIGLSVAKDEGGQIRKGLSIAEKKLKKLGERGPTGQVTLAFTDVQSSTSQWQMHPKVMQTALDIHNDIMRKRIDDCAGYEVKTEGDAFMVAFPSTSNALKWTLLVQHDLLHADWPEETYNHNSSKIEMGEFGEESVPVFRGLRIRMGLHTGFPKCEGDPRTGRTDYFGQMVNKSARVSSMAHGGQIFISEEVWSEVHNWFDALSTQIGEQLGLLQHSKLTEISGKHVGDVFLKGIDEPQPIFQVGMGPMGLRDFPKLDLGVPSAPKGRVVLCFTGIQGFTNLEEENQGLADKTLEIHHSFIRKRLIALRGYEVKTEGATFMVAFGNATAFLEWASSVQQGLLELDWDDDLLARDDFKEIKNDEGKIIFRGPRVKMGAHIGEPSDQKDPVTGRIDYFGRMVNRSARVAGASKGGQIVVSKQLLDSAEFDQDQFITEDLGMFSLKGLEEGANLFQVMSSFLSSRSFKEEKKADEKAPSTAPTGQVSIVFAGVQGAASQWETFPEVIREAISLNAEVFRKNMKKHDGYEVKTEGDAFMMSFPSPLLATRCCLDIQADLMEVDWPQELYSHPDAEIEEAGEGASNGPFRGLRVKMGIHTGNPISQQDPITGHMDYFGPMVNRSARVAGASYGGQIVFSGLTHDLFMESEEDVEKVKISKLGDYRLKGLDSDETLYQILPNALSRRVFPLPLNPPPIGDVTLVFTCVQGKKEIWDRAPSVMEQALEKHHSILKKFLIRFQGYLVKTEVDVFMVAFRSISSAVMWCLNCQEELMNAEWPEELEAFPTAATVNQGKPVFKGLRVAMGIHSGQPICTPDPITGRMDYFGPMVNRSARVMQYATGGQIVVSGAIWNHINEKLEEYESPSYSMLGEIDLKGLDTPELLVEILPSSLEQRSELFPKKETEEEEEGFKKEDVQGLVDDLQNKAEELDHYLAEVKETLESTNLALAGLEPRIKMEFEKTKKTENLEKLKEVNDNQHDIGSRVDDIQGKHSKVMDRLSLVIEEAKLLQERADQAYREKGQIQRSLVLVKGECAQLRIRNDMRNERIEKIEKKLATSDTDGLLESLLDQQKRVENLENTIDKARKEETNLQAELDKQILETTQLGGDATSKKKLKKIMKENKKLEAAISTLADSLVKESGKLAKMKETLVQMSEENYDESNIEKDEGIEAEIATLQEKIEAQTHLLEALKARARRKKSVLRKVLGTTHPALKVVQKIERDQSQTQEFLVSHQHTFDEGPKAQGAVSSPAAMKSRASTYGAPPSVTLATQSDAMVLNAQEAWDFQQKRLGVAELLNEPVIVFGCDQETGNTLGLFGWNESQRSFVLDTAVDILEVVAGTEENPQFIFTIPSLEKKTYGSELSYVFNLKHLSTNKFISTRHDALSASKKAGESEKIIATETPSVTAPWQMSEKGKTFVDVQGETISEKFIKVRWAKKKKEKSISLSFRVSPLEL